MTILKKLKERISRIVADSFEDEDEDDFDDEDLQKNLHLENLDKIEEALLAKGGFLKEGEGLVVGSPKPYRPKMSEGEDSRQVDEEEINFSEDSEKCLLDGEEKGKKSQKELDIQKLYPESFQETYALKNIDINTIQPLSSRKESKHSPFKGAFEGDQALFDFGVGYREWIDSPLLQEPIQVLGLSSHTQRILLENEKNTLQDCIGAVPCDFLSIKGMGQGHFDELDKSIQEYISDKQLYAQNVLDLESVIRCIFGRMENRRAYSFLLAYNLSHLVSLSKADQAIVSNCSLEEKKKKSLEAFKELGSEKYKHFFKELFAEITHAFIIPWMRLRCGIASQDEIMDRLVSVCCNGVTAPSILHLLSNIYFNGSFLLHKNLCEVDTETYCVDGFSVQLYCDILRRAKSYFYRRGLFYSFQELERCLLKEYAMEWRSLQEGVIKRVFQRSSLFRLRKRGKGELFVRLS